MAYNHGVKVSEKPTSILPPVSVSAGIPFIVGTAPVNMSDVSNVNRPVLCSSYAEAVAAFGFVPPVAIDASGLKKYEYSISQFIYSHFALFGANPVIIVNALDPTTHKKASNVTAVTLDADGSATVPESGIIKSSVSLGSGEPTKASAVYPVGATGTKAHGQYPASGTPLLTATARKYGASSNSLKIEIKKNSDYDGVEVSLYDGEDLIGTGEYHQSETPETIDGSDLNTVDITEYSWVMDYVELDGEISYSDIPGYDASPLEIQLSGGEGDVDAICNVEAKEAGEAGNAIRVICQKNGRDHNVTIYNGDTQIGTATLPTMGDFELYDMSAFNNAVVGSGRVNDYVEFSGDISLTDFSSGVEIQLSGGSDGSGGSGATYTEGVDYVTAFDDDGYLVINALKNTDGSYKIPTGTAIEFSAQRLNPAAVDASDIIGGVDVSGNKSGFELVDECFPRFRLVPGLLLAPGYSGNAALAAVMAAKAANINQEFTAIALIDVPTESVGKYSDVAAWKNTNSITDPRQIVCWPGVALDGVYYDLSVQLAGAIAITDSENEDVPYVSPSNHAINATASVLASGEEVWIAPDTGAYLNGQGVVTALNFIGGWVAWGNRTACYPANTDVKDSFIPVKRMFAWVGNTIIQTYWSKVDAPLNRRLIDTVLDSVNLWLNGLAARQYIIGGRVEFNPDENPSPDLLDGIARFHVYITPASPARELDFLLEYSPEYLNNLFA